MARTPEITTASFKPLSLDEIMMVPLAKQKMHDELLDATSEMNNLSANVLDKDAEEASAIVSGFKDKASQLASQIAETGVDRSQFNTLRQLRNEVQNQYGQDGYLGRAIANKVAASNYVNELATKKERQAGWSPQEAQIWAQHQVSQFQGTKNADGSFNSFAGQELAQKVDEDKFIQEAIDSVAERVDPISLGIVNMAGLPAFQKAYREGKVEYKDYNTIMDAIQSKSLGSPELMRSLQQSAFFTGEKTPTDIGRFEIRKNDKGEQIRVWVPGQSRFGMKASVFGRVGAYRNIDMDTKFIKDDLAYKMYTDGLEKQDALNLIDFKTGEMNQINIETLDKVRETLSLYKYEVEDLAKHVQTRKVNLEEEAKSKGYNAQQTAAYVQNDTEYKRLKGNYESKQIEYNNANNRLENSQRKVDHKLSEDDRKILRMRDDLAKYNNNPVEMLRQKYKKQISSEWAKRNGRNIEAEAIRQLYILENIDTKSLKNKSRNRGDMNTWPSVLAKVEARRDEAFKEYLAVNPTAENFTILNAEGTGKNATVIGRWSNLVGGENFNPDQQELAYGQGKLTDNDDFVALGESSKGYSYKVMPTDGFDDSGSWFKNVYITNNETGVGASFQVKEPNKVVLKQIAEELLTSNQYEQRKIGQQMLADYNHMQNIKEADLYNSGNGTIKLDQPMYKESVNKDGKKEYKRVNAEYKKNTGTDGVEYWEVTIGGKNISPDKYLYGEKDISLALEAFLKNMPQNNQ